MSDFAGYFEEDNNQEEGEEHHQPDEWREDLHEVENRRLLDESLDHKVNYNHQDTKHSEHFLIFFYPHRRLILVKIFYCIEKNFTSKLENRKEG